MISKTLPGSNPCFVPEEELDFGERRASKEEQPDEALGADLREARRDAAVCDEGIRELDG